jgi:hypothetical protein
LVSQGLKECIHESQMNQRQVNSGKIEPQRQQKNKPHTKEGQLKTEHRPVRVAPWKEQSKDGLDMAQKFAIAKGNKIQQPQVCNCEGGPRRHTKATRPNRGGNKTDKTARSNHRGKGKQWPIHVLVAIKKGKDPDTPTVWEALSSDDSEAWMDPWVLRSRNLCKKIEGHRTTWLRDLVLEKSMSSQALGAWGRKDALMVISASSRQDGARDNCCTLQGTADVTLPFLWFDLCCAHLVYIVKYKSKEGVPCGSIPSVTGGMEKRRSTWAWLEGL